VVIQGRLVIAEQCFTADLGTKAGENFDGMNAVEGKRQTGAVIERNGRRGRIGMDFIRLREIAVFYIVCVYVSTGTSPDVSISCRMSENGMTKVSAATDTGSDIINDTKVYRMSGLILISSAWM